MLFPGCFLGWQERLSLPSMPEATAVAPISAGAGQEGCLPGPHGPPSSWLHPHSKLPSRSRCVQAWGAGDEVLQPHTPAALWTGTKGGVSRNVFCPLQRWHRPSDGNAIATAPHATVCSPAGARSRRLHTAVVRPGVPEGLPHAGLPPSPHHRAQAAAGAPQAAASGPAPPLNGSRGTPCRR